jgi:hypothetical protein
MNYDRNSPIFLDLTLGQIHLLSYAPEGKQLEHLSRSMPLCDWPTKRPAPASAQAPSQFRSTAIVVFGWELSRCSASYRPNCVASNPVSPSATQQALPCFRPAGALLPHCPASSSTWVLFYTNLVSLSISAPAFIPSLCATELPPARSCVIIEWAIPHFALIHAGYTARQAALPNREQGGRRRGTTNAPNKDLF